MCIFSGPIDSVSATRIYARSAPENGIAWQWLVYDMRLSASAEVAMVLPLPVVQSGVDEAVEFADLSGCQDFFDQLGAVFGDGGPTAGGAPTADAAPKPLLVHRVGAFDASYVPGRDHLDRLDERFRLPSQVWDQLPDYSQWGFAVFQLRAEADQQVHPMALRFPSRDPDRLYVPTTHVHDGSVPPVASFDHAIYAQSHRDHGVLVSAAPRIDFRQKSIRFPEQFSWVPPRETREEAEARNEAAQRRFEEDLARWKAARAPHEGTLSEPELRAIAGIRPSRPTPSSWSAGHHHHGLASPCWNDADFAEDPVALRIVDPSAPLIRRAIGGERPNVDVWLELGP